MKHLHLLHQAIVDAGVPLRGLLQSGGEIVPAYHPDATDDERATAERLIDEWDGAAADAVEDARLAALAELEAIDLASVRALREYVAAQAGAPAKLLELEAQALAERAKATTKPGAGR